jgi:hypothetical protein
MISSRGKNFCGAALAVALASGGAITGAAAELPNTVLVAVTGNPAPGGGGVLTNLQPPVLSVGARAFFAADVRQGDTRTGSGIFMGDGTSLQPVVREGDQTPHADGIFGRSTEELLLLNGSNQVAFYNFLASSAIEGADHAVFLADSRSGQIRQLARSNLPTPSGAGIYEPARFFLHSFNDAGQVAFKHPALFSPFSFFADAIFRLDGTAEGDAEMGVHRRDAPGIDGTFWSVELPAINHLGQTVFPAVIRPPTVGSRDISIVRLEHGETVRELVRMGDPTPSGDGDFRRLRPNFISAWHMTLNDLGQVGLLLELENTSQGAANNEALYRVSASGPLEIARKGDLVPDGNGTFEGSSSGLDSHRWRHALNNTGEILFLAGVAGATNNARWGLFLSDGSALTQIVRAGDPAPGGGVFSTSSVSAVGAIALNHVGQIAFQALVVEVGGLIRNGIFVYDPTEGMILVARTGDSLAGAGSLSALNFKGGSGTTGSEGSGFNDLGQVAYRAFLSGTPILGGESAVAIWSGPRLVSPGRPALSVHLIESGLLRIAWEEVDDNWELVVSQELGSNAWTPANVLPQEQGSTRIVEVSLNQASQFFGLRRVAP